MHDIDIGTVLTHILVVLVAAKLAAEISERVGIPAVVGEIIAGILIGPSVLDIVGSDEVLRVLGELGVILLLLEVGLEMDIVELGRVGRTSLFVAVVGVVAPLLLGLGAMELIGDDFNTSLFIGAALTATSVGITARVFGDLRALATTEARIVLGAAVADDVIGLVVLTVVVRLVTEDSVSLVSVGGIVLVAVAFLVVGGVVALRVAPPLFSFVERISRSAGTMVAIALAFTLAFAQLADAAKLAPIVGAFVAGLALSRSRESDRIRRELAPVGHLFIPVFFLQIGIDADISAFGRAEVLRDAAILLAVAVVGKMLSPVGAIGSTGDKLLIGLGMLPRGEVGLIFASIGLANNVFDENLYAALLLVVLATTLVTPILLRWRSQRLRAGHHEPDVSEPEPAEGWLEVDDGEIVLPARPPGRLALQLAFETAVLAASYPPSAKLLDWFAAHRDAPITWTSGATKSLLDVVRHGNVRSWRFLDALGILERALPELSESLAARRSDPMMLDPTGLHRWITLDRLLEQTETGPLAAERAKLQFPERLLLAAVLVDALEGRDGIVPLTRRVVGRLGLGAAAEQEIALLVGDVHLLWDMALRVDSLQEENVLQLAAHLDSPETARAAYLLALAVQRRDSWEQDRLETLYDYLQRVLADPELGGLEARNLVSRQRAEAARLLNGNALAIERIEHAPRSYLLAQTPSAMARAATLLTRAQGRRTVAVQCEPGDVDGEWFVDVAASDRPGLLATITGVLAELGVDVQRAVIATWSDGGALDSFVVTARSVPVPAELERAITERIGRVAPTEPVEGAKVDFDDGASPWHTVCEVRASDRPGRLHEIATAFAAANVSVHAARLSVEHDTIVDRFEVTGPGGTKLDATHKERFADFLHSGVKPRRRRVPRLLLAAVGQKAFI
ncbi:MAG TPA: cation:proton antiporter [Acidimicrobiia bacterium]|nr:cation:proton antiporter [Acidimicrobiia bacterium]